MAQRGYLHRSSIFDSIILVLLMMAAPVLGVTEDQRLDHHRHRLRVGQLLADVDEIEIFEIDAVDRNDAAPGNQFALDDIAHELGDIGIEDQNQRLAVVDMRPSSRRPNPRPECELDG